MGSKKKKRRMWIPGYEGLYEVTRDGDVISHHRRKPRVLKQPRGTVSLCRDGTEEKRTVSHLVLEAFVGERPSRDHFAWHINLDREDCRAGNLQWGTRNDRTLDRKERDTLGEKLSVNDVKGMRELYAEGYSARELADVLDIHPNTVYKTCHRQKWKCVS